MSGPKLMIGETTATLLVTIIRNNRGRTPHDIAMLGNAELERIGRRAHLSSSHVNNFLSYHEEGQALVRDRMVAAVKNKKLPAWADEMTPRAYSVEQLKGELVAQPISTGLSEVDTVFESATKTVRTLSRSLPASRQAEVIGLNDKFKFAAMTIKLQQQVIEAQNGEGNMARQLIGAR